MRSIRTKTRPQWIKAHSRRNGRFTEKKIEKAFRHMALDGWYSALPPFGPTREKVPMVHGSSSLADIVRAVSSGQSSFSMTDLDRRLGLPLASSSGCHALARAGLAMVSVDGDQIILHPFNPDGAKLINVSRCHYSARGYLLKNVIEAILTVRDPQRSRANVNDQRRIDAAVLLDYVMQISADDLLNYRSRVRLSSKWMFAKNHVTSIDVEAA